MVDGLGGGVPITNQKAVILFMYCLDMRLCQRPLLIMAGVGSSSGQHLRPLGLNLNLGFFFSGGNVVCAEEPRAKNGAPSKESGACRQSFATEGLPYLSPSLCGLWHGKQGAPQFLLVFLKRLWRRRKVSGTVPWHGIPSTSIQIYLSRCCAGGETCV